MKNVNNRILYGVKDQELLDETPEKVIQTKGYQICGTGDAEEEIEVFEYKPMKLELDIDYVLDDLYENLNNEYGDPDGGYTVPTAEVKKAAQNLINTIKQEYFVWACEVTNKSKLYSVRLMPPPLAKETECY